MGEAIDFESLYRASRDDVYAYVARLVGDRWGAEEVTATVFERALARREAYVAGRGSPRAWLFGIARNAAYDELRRRGRTEPVASPEPIDERREDATADVAVARATAAIALRRLGADDRELVGLKFEAGLSNREIAAILGTSESNVGTRLCRVITRLRGEMS